MTGRPGRGHRSPGKSEAAQRSSACSKAGRSGKRESRARGIQQGQRSHQTGRQSEKEARKRRGRKKMGAVCAVRQRSLHKGKDQKRGGERAVDNKVAKSHNDEKEGGTARAESEKVARTGGCGQRMVEQGSSPAQPARENRPTTFQDYAEVLLERRSQAATRAPEPNLSRDIGKSGVLGRRHGTPNRGNCPGHREKAASSAYGAGRHSRSE